MQLDDDALNIKKNKSSRSPGRDLNLEDFSLHFCKGQSVMKDKLCSPSICLSQSKSTAKIPTIPLKSRKAKRVAQQFLLNIGSPSRQHMEKT